MPVERVPVSVSQFCELLGIEPEQFVGVEVQKPSSRVLILVEPDDGTDQRNLPATE